MTVILEVKLYEAVAGVCFVKLKRRGWAQIGEHVASWIECYYGYGLNEPSWFRLFYNLVCLEFRIPHSRDYIFKSAYTDIPPIQYHTPSRT